MSNSITLTSSFGYTPYKLSNAAANTTVDATQASWIVANQGSQTNTYPFQVVDAGDNLVVKGGTIHGQIPQTGDWRAVYDAGNSAAVLVRSQNNFVIDDWTITQAWDGIRPHGGGTFLIDDTYITNARDDAVESDDAMGGTIRDSLFDNVFSGVSTSDGDFDGSDNTLTMDSMLLSMKTYSYDGRMTHGSPFKLQYNDNTGGNETNPHLKFVNSVVAISDVNHIGMGRLEHAWERMTADSTGNVYLNLSDTPLPSDYPLPPFGWMVLQGQAARDYWAKVKADWHTRHENGEVDPTPTPTLDPEPTPTLTALVPTFSTLNFTGASSDEIIVGNAQANRIEAKNGADTVWGGAGNDTFVLTRGGDMDNSDKAVDLYMDFTRGADKFDLYAIDANETVSGNQNFSFIGEAAFTAQAGQVRSFYDSAKDVTRIQLNTDTDSKVEYWFDVAGKHALTAADFAL